MTIKEMNRLADIIIAKLEVKQAEWDEEFHSNIADLYGKEPHREAFVLSEEEMLIGELARLQTILMIYENNEEFEKAAIILSKLQSIKSRLRKGDFNND
jgi:protein-arginine kinase activator protein McsA